MSTTSEEFGPATRAEIMAKRDARTASSRGRYTRGPWTIDISEQGADIHPTLALVRPEMRWEAIVTPTASLKDYCDDHRVYGSTREELDRKVEEYLGSPRAAKLLAAVERWERRRK